LFSPGTPVSSTKETDRHDIAEILMKVALNTINLTILFFHIKMIRHVNLDVRFQIIPDGNAFFNMQGFKESVYNSVLW
jgi:hypothetical protein